ncbi:hypothetical protein [Kribbella sp. NBC_00889]|uniref:hypothetical protein n=1 Tax=Kribbella sp. NBC_00889 TaxID=2975974 RepID=UPI0038698DE8|nr:hypothetical protein OG817_07835 [Kribbella sp. NBC_00889]
MRLDVHPQYEACPGLAENWSSVSQGRFVLPDGRTEDARVEEAVQDRLYRLRYFGSTWTFTLVPDESGGTDLTLSCDDAQDGSDHVSLLLRLKALVDFGVDLRNHDDGRTAAYVDS